MSDAELSYDDAMRVARMQIVILSGGLTPEEQAELNLMSGVVHHMVEESFASGEAVVSINLPLTSLLLDP